MSFRPPLSVLSTGASAHPARLGKYTLTGVLGEGAMGTVYKAFDPVIQRPVAVKAIRTHLLEPGSMSVSAAQRFRTEAKAAGRLTHPGIVRIYEYGEDDGAAFIAMEYVEGHGLNHYIAPPARLAEPEALGVMMQLLEALDCAHEQGVSHRDIKPNNIIITPAGRLKIADFGIARIESAELTQMTVLIGSPGYIAPERYTGETPDQRVDIFSCGVLLYQMLTGLAPFVGTDTEVMYKVLHTEPTPPSQAAVLPPRSDRWDAIVAKALAKRPEDRYASAHEFREALFCAAPWPIPATLSREVVDGVERRLAGEAATVMQIRARVALTVPPCLTKPLLAHLASSPQTASFASLPARPMSKECALMAELVAQLAAQALAREQQRSLAESPQSPPISGTTTPLSADFSADPQQSAETHAAEPSPCEKRAAEPNAVHPRAAGPSAGEPRSAEPRTAKPLAAEPRSAESDPVQPRAAQPLAGVPSAAQPRVTTVPHAAESRTVPPPSPCAPPTLMVPLTRRATPAPPTPEVIAKAQRVLAEHIGPIARLMVKNAASIATTRDQFYAVLADLAADCVDRERLLRDLSRIA